MPTTPTPFARAFTAALLTALLSAATLTSYSAQAGVVDFVHGILHGGGSRTYELHSPERHLRIQMYGKAHFNALENDIESITGRMLIRDRRAGHTRQLILRQDDTLGVKRIYKLDGVERAMDADARAWLAEVIPAFLRESAFNVEARTQRLLAKGGFDAVLSEIALIESGHARGKYIEALASSAPLDEARLTKLLSLISPKQSSYEQRVVLTALLRGNTLSAQQQALVLAAVAKMESSFEQRQVMQALLPNLSDAPPVQEAWSTAINAMESDFEIRSVIDSMTKRASLSPAQLELAITATTKIDSDFERASALEGAAKHLTNAPQKLLQAYMHSAQEIDSDFERARVLLGVVNRISLNKNGFALVLNATEGMDSSFELARVMKAIAKRMPAEPELLNHYRKTARRLDGFERGEVERALDRL